MSDIAMPPGFTLLAISVFAATVCLGLMLGLLLLNFFVQRGERFARRLPFRLLIGTLLPLIVAVIGVFLSDAAPREWRIASERLPEWGYVASYVALLAIGWLLGRRL